MDELRASAAQTQAQMNMGFKGSQLGGGGGRGGSMFGGQIRGASFTEDPMADVRTMKTPQIRQFGRLRRTLLSVSGSSRMAHRAIGRLAGVTTLASHGFSKLRTRVAGATAAIAAQIPSLRSLQMTLLGVQFQLLSLAFIFGGLMGSALGAVGVFKILGNTLKMFFLPAALDILPVALSIQDALLGVDEETRRMIGRIFFAIATFAALGSILAFATNGFLAVLSVFKPFFLVLKAITGLVGSVAGAFGVVISALAGIVAGFKVVNAIFKKFGKIVGLIVGVLITIGAIVGAVLVGPFLAAAGLIGVAIGAIISILWNFRSAVWNILTAVAGFFMDIFKGIYNFLVGNSIIPDLVNDIISWLMKLPKAALNFGKQLINGFVKGIKSMGGAIWNAFKKVLPDFVVDALEGIGSAVGQGIGAVGNFAGGAINAAQNFAGGIGNAVGGLFGGGRERGGQTNVQNNNINASVNIQDSRETPEETGRKFGQATAQGLNNQNSNISSGT